MGGLPPKHVWANSQALRAYRTHYKGCALMSSAMQGCSRPQQTLLFALQHQRL